MAIPRERMESLYPQVRSILAEALSLGDRGRDLKPNSGLLGTLPELDSQAVLHVLMGLEEHFAIAIDDDDVEASVFDTLETLTEFVARKTSGD